MELFDTHTHGTIKLVGGFLQRFLNLTEGSLKTNPDAGQSGIWTRDARMQIHPDHWAAPPH